VRIKRTSGWLLVGLVFSLSYLSIAGFRRAEDAEVQRYLEHVKKLASPEMEGRGAGTAGLERAARYVAAHFKEFGLKPAGESDTYRQGFTVTTDAKPGASNEFVVQSSAGTQALGMQKDFIPLSFSSNGEVKAPVVFAGYGITAPEFKYDDYAHIDVKDKIALVFRYEPKGFIKGNEQKRNTHHAHLVSKAINARNHGAKAVLLVDATDNDRLIRFGSVAGPDNAGILMAQMAEGVADQWLKKAGKPLNELEKQINDTTQPASFALAADFLVSLKVDIEREQAKVSNVLGYLPGKTKEYIVVGAHYDHLGKGNESSLAPSQIGQVHPGADDNASGTAALLELARSFSNRGELQRGVLFAAFAGEEIGLLGSAHWVNHPTLPLENAVAMLNMDMIGRVTGSKLYIGGTGTGSNFDPMLKRVAGAYDFKIDYSRDGYSASDHTSFVGKSIPVLFFFSGLHGDYHKPSDTWSKIDPRASAQVVNLVEDVAGELVSAEQRAQFIKPEGGGHGHGTMPSGGGGGYGPYFGSIPDFAPIENGVKFSDVRPGSPADKAGLKGSDILVQFGDKPIKNLYDFTFALRNSKVGDTVEVKVLREGKEMAAKVTLEARR
jgi:hypothetical protein